MGKKPTLAISKDFAQYCRKSELLSKVLANLSYMEKYGITAVYNSDGVLINAIDCEGVLIMPVRKEDC